MSRNVKPYEILAGPAEVYFAPTGTAPPDIAAQPGTEWIHVGYTEGGVKVGHTQTVVEIRADQVTAPVKAVRSEEGLEISMDIASLTLENYALALNQAIDGPDASVGGEKSLKMYRGGSLVETIALLCRNDHLSPEGDFPLQYEAPAVFNTGSPEVNYVKDNKAVLSCSFHAIADPERSDDTEAFGRLRVGTA